jgi:hypothetical protein
LLPLTTEESRVSRGVSPHLNYRYVKAEWAFKLGPTLEAETLFQHLLAFGYSLPCLKDTVTVGTLVLIQRHVYSPFSAMIVRSARVIVMLFPKGLTPTTAWLAS